MNPDERLVDERFPQSSAYHPDWVLSAVSGGANSLWLTEWLTEAMDLRPGMRVLDLGCGRGASSIFLHRELGVQVPLRRRRVEPDVLQVVVTGAWLGFVHRSLVDREDHRALGPGPALAAMDRHGVHRFAVSAHATPPPAAS